LVTGASSGIGEAIAERLARDGVDVVVVARRRDQLDALAERCAGSTGSVEVLVADLCDPDDLDRVAARVASSDRPVDLLVNNAGVGVSGPFAGAALDRYRAMMRLNAEAMVALCLAAVVPMKARGRGWIVNVSSLGGLAPGPGFAVYSATKAFVVSLSESLHEELRSDGVVVTVVCPGATHTGFGETAGSEGEGIPGFLWQSADEVAAEALSAAASARALRVTGLANRIPAGIMSFLPRSVRRRVAALVTDRI